MALGVVHFECALVLPTLNQTVATIVNVRETGQFICYSLGGVVGASFDILQSVPCCEVTLGFRSLSLFFGFVVLESS